MKLKGKLDAIVKDSKGDVKVTFIINNYTQRELTDSLKEEEYAIDLKKYKDDRTINQNKLLWELIKEIDIAINGTSNPENEMSIYISALLKAGAKYDYVCCKAEMEEVLREKFRAIQYVKSYDDEKGTNVYRIFYGSSKMNKEEFSVLVEAIKQMAYEFGVDMRYWEEELK